MNNGFCRRRLNPELPASVWDLNFSEQAGTTKVSIAIYNESLTRMEQQLEMGFKGGFTKTSNYLQDLLKTLSQRDSRKKRCG